MYEIVVVRDAVRELTALKAYDRRIVVEAIHQNLAGEPTRKTRHQKLLVGVVPPFEASPPIWELRVGDWRVFYDVDEDEKRVHVRAIRKKPPHTTTEDIP